MSSSQVCAPWATEADLPATCDTTAVKPATLVQAMGFASNILFSLTGRRWPGECEDTIRPCRSAVGCERCGIGLSMLELPRKPVTAITEILLDGQVLAPSNYELRDNGWLAAMRQPDGTRITWYCCQDLSLATTERGTMEISYTYGEAPPDDGVIAAALLGWEFAVSWTPDCSIKCRLPQRVQTITRQGVSMTVLDPLTLFDDGRTGIAEVDMWLASLRYGDARGSAMFLDIARGPIATRAT